jgi:hypothetical protein
MKLQISKTKLQHPISKHQTTAKSQTPGRVVNSAGGPGSWWLKFVWCLEIGFWCLSPGQNIIEDRAIGLTAPAIQISESQALVLVSFPFQSSTNRRSAEMERIARKLDRHVGEFIDGWPWMPFQHTLGISGYETYFNHPDEMFYALSLALPVLPTNAALKTKNFLAQRLAESPPFSVDGFENRTGRVREAYDVPSSLRLRGMGKARSAFGVYAFWSYVNATGDAAAAKNHWGAIKQRVQLLLDSEYQFDVANKNYAHDEAEVLNGNLAALIATVRLARTNADQAIERKALSRTRQLLELRVNLERVNAKILEATDSTTKHLHTGKLARFCGLTPEIGEALRTVTDGCGAAHLKDFREARNAWYLAFGDRMIGGENYTNPMHFSRALFAGAVLTEQLPPEQVASFVDVPWCKGDFYFIEKCALVLGAAR